VPSYRLHYFPESGNSYKLALMLTLCGERFEPVWTDFGGGVTRTKEWRRGEAHAQRRRTRSRRQRGDCDRIHPRNASFE